MKAQRISSKDYEDLLKLMRRWPQPYVAIAAKLIGHIAWQFEENKRLDNRLKKLEQEGLLDSLKKPQATTTQITTPPLPIPPPKSTVENDKWPLAKRLAYYRDNEDNEAWEKALKWNKLSGNEAMEMIKDVK